jgi:transposase
VELYEQIRRDAARMRSETGEVSVRALAALHETHRRTVRLALESATPPQKRAPVSRPAPVLGAFHDVIDEWLLADREAPRKQRHSARRVFERLRDEHGCEAAETTVRRHVRARRRALGLAGEGFVPQAYVPAADAQVDWGEAHVVLAGQRTRVFLFGMRACWSGAAYWEAFPTLSQTAFLEGHARAFEWFGGVFETIRYDNLNAAVKKVVRGHRREQTDRFIALRSHYLFDSDFTTPGIAGAHEKGGIEGEVGRFRRRHLVPVPAVRRLGELNQELEACIEHDLARRIDGRPETVGAMLWTERGRLARLPADEYTPAEHASVRVDQKSLVTVRQRRYSVPTRLVGMRVQAEIGAHTVTIRHDGQIVARHDRAVERFATTALLDHYLDLLARKPGALRRALPLAQARDRGDWPSVYDELWRLLEEKTGRSEAASQMVDVLLLCREHTPEAVERAVAGALAAGAIDGRAVQLLCRRTPKRPALKPVTLDDRVQAIEVPTPSISVYDELLRADRGER